MFEEVYQECEVKLKWTGEVESGTCQSQELCESRGGRGWAPVPNKPTVSVAGRKATLDQPIRAQELCESREGRPGLPSPISLRFLWT